MAAISTSDVIRATQLAWNIYRMGWGEEFDASQQYQDFGDDIKSLAENLDNILRVVENAKTTWAQSLRLGRFRGQTPQKDWDLSSLEEIIGDYHRTLADCKKLIEENYEFRKNRNFALNIEWNLVIQPKVNQLRRRLDSHNSKILILLKPLELNLLADIHYDLAERIDAVHRSILHLQGLLIPDVEQALLEQGQVIPNALQVPPDIERKFQAAAEESHPEIRTPGKFPLQAGADALVAHLADSTKKFTPGNFLNERTPPPKQYLSLLKCIWIMRHLQASDMLRDSPKDSQWPGYVNQLNEDLCMECRRFAAPSAQRLIAPDLSSARHVDEYKIWLGENIAEYISPHFETYMEEVLKIPMPSPSESLRRDMTIFRLQATKYRLVESVEPIRSAEPGDDKYGVSTRPVEIKIDIDLKSVLFTPLYATPSSKPKALDVLIHSGTTQITPTFQELKHVLNLQHLLTGYKVYQRYDQAMVTISTFVSGQAAPIEEHGRIQLWLPLAFDDPLSPTSPTPSEAPSAAQSSRASIKTATESKLLGYFGPKGTKTSQKSSRSSATATARTNRSNSYIPTVASNSRSSSSFSFNPTPSVTQNSNRPVSIGSSLYSKHRTPSIMTNSSSLSRRSNVSSVTTISTGTGQAHLHEKPAKPLLVIFLKSREAPVKLAIAAIQIDDKTEVKWERCRCRTSESQCRVSCIERSDGFLLAQRWDAHQGLGSWNLASLGVEQRKELPEDAWNDVKRVSMKFETVQDRCKFAGSPCSCNPKMQHDLSRCVLAGHRGVFGVVRQIGSQRLRNYHQERENAAGKNMVLGSLPGDEL